MRTNRATVTALSLAAIMATSVSACDKGAPKAADAWNKAQERMGTYTSLHVKGNGTAQQRATDLDVNGTVDGKTQTMTMKQGAAVVEVRTVSDKIFIKGSKEYYDQLGKDAGNPGENKMAAALADKWVQAPTGAKKDTAFIGDLLKNMRNDSNEDSKKLLSDKATITKEAVDGKDAWKITSEDKQLSAWVTADDNYDLLKTEGFGSGSGSSSPQPTMSSATFSAPNAAVEVSAPAGAKSMTEVMMEGVK